MRIKAIVVAFVAALGLEEPWSCVEGIDPSSDPLAPPPSAAPVLATVRVDVQMVSVSIAEARDLVPEFQNRQKSPAAWARLQGMITEGKAQLLAWPVTWLDIGGDGRSESCLECRYATEYTPPQIPQTFSFIASPAAPESMWGKATPTAFETRNTGSWVQVEAVKASRDGVEVYLNIVTGFVRLIRMHEWRGQRSPLGIVGVFAQPDFQTAKVTTSLCAHRDEPLLIGVSVQSEPAPHVELHILHTRATILPPSVSHPPPQ